MIKPPENGMWPSPFNPGAESWGGATRRIRIADCTLRDGEQQAGVVLDRKAKLAIARALDAMGIYEIEAGTVASSEEDRAAIADMVSLGLAARLSVLCRGLTGDIDMAADLGVWGVRLSFPISQVERAHKLKGISDEDYLEKALSLTAYARQKGLHVIFSPYDTTRADPQFLDVLVRALNQSGTVDRLRIVDTTGCALPEAIGAITSRIARCAPGLALEIHCHNDFGLACANTLAAVRAGADYVSSTINGLGERCGNASTEEVVMALEVLEGYRTGLKLDQFSAISAIVAELSGIPVPVNKAVVGANAFRHEAGMVVAGVLKEPFTAEAYKPEIVGQTREILLGKKSGLVSIAHKLEALGLTLDQGRHGELLESVKILATRQRRALNDAEFTELVERCGNDQTPAGAL
jgi:isopropylmalate/homocitrate/citramalate synthase